MILVALMTVFTTIFIDPLNAVLPTYTVDLTGVATTVDTYLDSFDAMVPIGPQLELAVVLVGVGGAVLAIIGIVWVWNAVRP